MANLITLFKKIDDFKTDFAELIRQYANELRNEISENIRKEMREKQNQELRKFEKLQLSKSNAQKFLKIIQIIEELKDKNNLGEGKIANIAEKYNISHDEAKFILDMVRYARIYQKFVEAKSEIYKYL